MQTCGVWMAAWLEHAACQLQAAEQVFFAVKEKGWIILRG
ncbi:putative signal peptide protein [Puccinia sorghi]|uniref:Putative signal peptide protein n=1 Tax=Puccinia sorghi TaxID=27349 RepID=A0A0L6VE13_9BASI|nr:putative signal peptide protein [Puccinia sorghi]